MNGSSGVLHVSTQAPEETRDLGAGIATLLRAGDVVALTGELGAGKTCFVQGAAAALGVRGRVTSPTFLLRRDYEGDFPVLHLDVYRLDNLQDVLELGWEEALDGTRVTFIEWGDAMSPLLPSSHLEIEFRVEPDERRRIALRPRGEGWLRRAAELAVALKPWDGSGPPRDEDR